MPRSGEWSRKPQPLSFSQASDVGCLRELSVAEQGLAVLEHVFGVTAASRSLAVLQKQRALGVENHGHPIGDTE